MTIRQHIGRRFAWGLGALFLAMGFLVITGVTADGKSTSPFFIIGMLAVLGAAAFINLGIRCTKCRGNLGITILPAIFPSWSKHRINYCPYCGVSIDEKC